MRTYQFGLPNSDRVITITANSFKEARKLFIAQLQTEDAWNERTADSAEGLL